MVTVGFGNTISLQEAAELLSCSVPSVYNAVKKRKIKAQKINDIWRLDYDEVQRALSTHLIKPRLKRRKEFQQQKKLSSASSTQETQSNEVILKISLDRPKYELMKIVLSNNNTTVTKWINEQVEKLYQKVYEGMKGIQL